MQKSFITSGPDHKFIAVLIFIIFLAYCSCLLFCNVENCLVLKNCSQGVRLMMQKVKANLFTWINVLSNFV